MTHMWLFACTWLVHIITADHPEKQCLAEPPELAWTYDKATRVYSATLEFNAKTFDAASTGFPTGFTTRTYNGQIPGPTIRMKRDKTYEILLQNLLDPIDDTNPTAPNVLKYVNVTNLHTHGLHVSPEAPADFVLAKIDGGESRNYRYEVPCDHAGGTFWYHPHIHGSTAIQVGGGAVGALIVEDDKEKEGLPDWLTDMDEMLLVIQHFDLNEVQGFAAQANDRLFSVDDPLLGDFYTINGNYEPDICLTAGVWKRLRIVFADIDVNNEFFMENEDGINGDECEVYLIAKDGVLVHGGDNTVPRELVSRSMFFTGASRADIAIRCPAGTHTLYKTAGAHGMGSIGQFVVTEDSDSPSSDEVDVVLESFSPIRPPYLVSLLDRNANEFQTEEIISARFGWKFMLSGETFLGDPGAADADQTGATYVAVMESGQIQEWFLNGQRHPIHIHVNHFQISSEKADIIGHLGTDPAWTLRGDWLDTIEADANVRFYTDRYGGTVVVHCHILKHEDEGMMRLAYINGGCPATGKCQDCDGSSDSDENEGNENEGNNGNENEGNNGNENEGNNAKMNDKTSNNDSHQFMGMEQESGIELLVSIVSVCVIALVAFVVLAVAFVKKRNKSAKVELEMEMSTVEEESVNVDNETENVDNETSV